MKAKKALKRLNRADALLSSVLEKYAETHPQIRGLVNSAKASVSSAKKAVGHPSTAPAAAKRVVAKAESGGRRSRIGAATSRSPGQPKSGS
jgi:hypothetical protein